MRRVALAVGLATAFQAAAALALELSSVEAYLWMCARHLAPAYFDYPGMSPWLVALSTSLAGHSTLGVRLLSIACAAGTPFMVYLGSRRLFAPRTAELAGVLAAWLPFFLRHGAYATPDAPLLFFWSAAFWALAVVFSGGPRAAWLLAGLFAGLALDSKYQAIFLPFGLFLFLLASPDHRGWLARRDPLIAALVALLAFSPTIVWNARNEWTSFAYQGLSRFSERGFRARELLEFPRSQLLWFTPLVAVALWASGARVLARWRTSPWPERLCAALGLPLLIFFVLTLFRRPVRGHWAGPAYLTLLPLAVAAAPLAARWTARVLGAALALGIVALPLLPRERVEGWSRLAEEVGRRSPDFVIGREYHLASQLGYRLRPLPAVDFAAVGRPSKSFGLWWNGEAFRGKTALLVSDPRHEEEDRKALEGRFDRLEAAERVEVPRFRDSERFTLIRAVGYRPP